MKCRVCRGPAVVDVRRHNAGFCREHFLRHCEEQVRRAIDEHPLPRFEHAVRVDGAADLFVAVVDEVLLAERRVVSAHVDDRRAFADPTLHRAPPEMTGRISTAASSPSLTS